MKLFKRNRKAIKVCRKGRRNRNVSAFEDGILVEYKIKEWVGRPTNGGALAVFDTLKHAENFTNGYCGNSHRLFKCKYKPSETKALYRIHEVYGKRIKDYPPKGTLFAEKVKILKEINNF